MIEMLQYYGEPMFTQQHYRKIAEVIHQRRVKTKESFGGVSPNGQLHDQMQAIADLTKDLMDMFKEDNHKFNALLFIEASSKDLK